MYKDRLPPESLYALKKRKGLVGSSPGTPAFSQAKGFNPTETAAVPISFRAPCIHNYQPQSKCSDLMPAVEGPTSQTAHDTVAKSKLRKQHSCFRFISCILRRGKKNKKREWEKRHEEEHDLTFLLKEVWHPAGVQQVGTEDSTFIISSRCK